MRCIGFVILSFLLLNFVACKSTQKNQGENSLVKMDSVKGIAKKLYFFKNKKLEVTGEPGSISYKMIDNKGTDIIRYSYERNMDQVAFDGGYREEVVFEIPNTSSQEKYIDENLQKTSMLFGRYCHCRGKNGLFKVTQGELVIASSKKEPHFELNFKVDELPQVITNIKY